MSLIAAGTDHSTHPEARIPNNGFWPDIDPADFRATQRLDESVTAARLRHSLEVAMADVNRQLADYQAEQQDDGIAYADDIPPAAWHRDGHHGHLYRRAVYAQALADLLERYRRISATQQGDERGEAQDAAADDVRADARWAIAELTGGTHTTVELI
ncbi:MAG: head completion/stabilization protein [Phycisphaeraceae bacterium]